MCKGEPIIDCVHRVIEMILQLGKERVTTHTPETPKANPTPTEKVREYCRHKIKIGNIERYVKSLKAMGILVDWWDKGDEYCFKVKETPKSS